MPEDYDRTIVKFDPGYLTRLRYKADINGISLNEYIVNAVEYFDEHEDMEDWIDQQEKLKEWLNTVELKDEQ